MRRKANRCNVTLPELYLRMEDDILIEFVGTWPEFQEYKALADAMDPNRALEWDISLYSVNWLDLTLYCTKATDLKQKVP